MDNIGIILLVSERSGSNLLRTLLGNHNQICAPISPHFLAEFMPLSRFYADLREYRNKKRLFNDMLSLANHKYNDWGLNMNWEDILQVNFELNSVLRMMDFLYSAKAKSEKKIHYCSKDIQSIKYIDQIRGELNNIRFVHLVRDPRDHVTSWLKRPINMFTAYDIIQKWKIEQNKVMENIKFYGLNCISVTYEELIENSENSIKKILEYINLPIDKSCFNTNPQNKESNWNPYWENLSKPIMKENKKKYMNFLEDEEVEMIETIATEEMYFFGYNFETSRNWKPSRDSMKKIDEKRIIGRLEAKSSLKNKMPLLEDKHQFITKLHKELKKSSITVVEPNRSKDINKNIKTSTIGFNRFVNNRIKYLSYAILGTRLSSRLQNTLIKYLKLNSN